MGPRKQVGGILEFEVILSTLYRGERVKDRTGFPYRHKRHGPRAMRLIGLRGAPLCHDKVLNKERKEGVKKEEKRGKTRNKRGEKKGKKKKKKKEKEKKGRKKKEGGWKEKETRS